MSRIIAPQWTNRRRRGRGVTRSKARRLRRNDVVPKYFDGLVLYLDARQLDLSNDDGVPTWTDRSGNGNELTQGTASAQPTYKAAGLNGKPGVEFDGSDDILTSTSFGSEWSGDDAIATWVAVIELPSTGNAGYFWGPNNGSDSDQLFNIHEESATWGIHVRGSEGGGGLQFTGVATDTSPRVVSCRFTPQVLRTQRDGPSTDAIDVDGSTTSTMTFDQFGLGGLFRTSTGNHAAFTLGMLAGYNELLGPDEVREIEDFMGDAYGITIS